MDKKQLTEAYIRTKFITPALVGTNGANWNVMTMTKITNRTVDKAFEIYLASYQAVSGTCMKVRGRPHTDQALLC